MHRIDLGDKVRDIITGFEGVAIARSQWLVGCERISVQPQDLDKDGGVKPFQTFDEPQLEIIAKNAVIVPIAATPGGATHAEKGGPRPEIPRASLP